MFVIFSIFCLLASGWVSCSLLVHLVCGFRSLPLRLATVPPWLLVVSSDFSQVVFHCSDTPNFCFLPTVCFLSVKLLLLSFIFFPPRGSAGLFLWLKGILGQEQKLFFTTTSLVPHTNFLKGNQRYVLGNSAKKLVSCYMCMSVSVAWPIATEFDSDEGLRDITFLQVSWQIASWMSTETKINLPSRDSCISIVRNQRKTVGMIVKETDPTSYCLPCLSLTRKDLSSLSFSLQIFIPNITEILNKVYVMLSWEADAPSPSSYCWKGRKAWQVECIGKWIHIQANVTTCSPQANSFSCNQEVTVCPGFRSGKSERASVRK